MSTRRGRWLLWLLITLGCDAPREIVVVVDVQPGTLTNVEALRLTVEGRAEPITLDLEALPATLGVQGRDGVEALDAHVTASLATGGELVARGRLAFVSSSRQMLYFELDESCPIECEGSCFRGDCRALARVAPCPFVASVVEGGVPAAAASHGCFGDEARDGGPRDADPRDADPRDADLDDAGPDAGGCGPSCADWTHLSLGPRHACGVRGGAVFCWGSNERGQIGFDSFTPASIPTAVVGILGRAEAVEVGDRHSCALTEEGDVYCWGEGAQGQLGTSEVRRSTAAPVPGVSVCTALASGADFSCAVCGPTSAVSCWGTRHGLATSARDPMPPTQTPVSEITGLTAGAAHVCAWNPDTEPLCWGDAPAGVLGHGDSSPAAPVGLGAVRRLDAGRRHTCAITTDGNISCWGENASGEAGPGPPVLTPGQAVIVGSFVAVSAGALHSCAITDAGALWCWGSTANGHLGVGASSAPEVVAGRAGWTSLSVGRLATCGVDAAGERSCFGYDPTGIVSESGLVQLRPQPMNPDVVDVALGAGHGCGTLSLTPSRLTCWGEGAFGQRGDGTVLSSNRAPNTASTGDDTSGYVTAAGLDRVSAGPAQTCAISASTMDVHCWGDGSTAVVWPANPLIGAVLEPRPTLLFDNSDPAALLALGARHACGLSTSGVLRCWGFDDERQLGTGFSALPTEPPRSDLSAGRAHNCLIAEGLPNTVWCWGSNAHLQSEPSRTDRTPVEGPAEVNLDLLRAPAFDVATGDDFSCATDGTSVVCWGLDDEGQLGNPDSSSPVQVVSGVGGGLLGVTAGAAHACAWSATEAYCWGRNHSGQLSGASVSPSEPPRPVDLPPSVATLARMAAGEAHTCMETNAGTFCWGTNEDWRLGLGTARPLTVPP